jgi:uracil-DNA glycosylase
VENVTDRTLNPFGIDPPCEADCPGGHAAVFGYGDANADVHLVGDHPGIHGGADDGIPFSADSAEPLRAVLADVGLATDPGDDEPYRPRNLFCSYLYACCPAGDPPGDADYARLEPSFDAELRAIAAHVLLPVGDRALAYVLEEYTGQARRLPADATQLHARELRGRGFLVVPVREPADWTDGDRTTLRDRLAALLSSDYRRTADLGRFLADDDAYLVR